MVIELHTDMPSENFIQELKDIERTIGRTVSKRWGPREIDLDLLYYGSEVFNNDTLHVPHPEIANRRFVLVPMKEIAASFFDPLRHLTIAELLQRCADTNAVRKISEPMTFQTKE
jgi:2-amino-4-hydroxy-6-hydroxymethyldihydropteridine diphosphokinase